MKKENEDVKTSWWRQLFRKRWFFPALYLMIAALLLATIIWYQNVDDQTALNENDALEVSDHYLPVHQTGENGEENNENQESFQKPIAEGSDIEIVTKFYDYDADEEAQERALILLDNHYLQSKGIDMTLKDDDAPFEVLASLSGTVTKVKNDPILGHVVVISHDNDVETYYSSLGKVTVDENDKVSQGDVIGQAGKSDFGKDYGNHVHFEIRKNNVAYNPEVYFNQPLNELLTADANVDEDEQNDFEEENEDNENNVDVEEE